MSETEKVAKDIEIDNICPMLAFTTWQMRVAAGFLSREQQKQVRSTEQEQLVLIFLLESGA